MDPIKRLPALLLAASIALTAIPARAGGQQSGAEVVAASTSGPVAADPPKSNPDPAVETEALRLEIGRLREIVETQQRALGELERRLERVAPVSNAAEPRTVAASSTEPAPVSTAAQEALQKQVDELTKRWGKLRLSGDVQVRAESFFNQGYDGAEVGPRNRFRLRARVQLAGDVTKNLDWGIRVATGSFDNPVSLQQSFSDYYTRKPFALDRAFIRFTSKTDPVDIELVGGKFEPNWKRTPFTLDPDLQPEGFSQSVRFSTGDSTPLRAVKLTAWELPFRERSVGADAVILGGQILTEWKWSNTLSTSLSGSFHEFEQVNLIPPVVNVSPTLVDAGFDYGTTNTVVVNPVTGLPEYRSDYRVLDAIAEVKYTGFAEKFPLTVTANYLHNTSAFNNQRDGGLLQVDLGRRQEKNDWGLEYWFWKAERDVFPSVFMDSEVAIQTNSLTHAIKASYLVQRQVQLDFRYLVHRRLQTLAAINRWQNHVQFDVTYRF